MRSPPQDPHSPDPRPLTLPPADQDWRNTLWALLGALMFGAMLAAACIWTAPALVTDWQIRDRAQPVADGRLTEGKCSSKLVLHICDVTVAVRTPAGVASRSANLVFAGVHLGDQGVRVMADPARPELATTDLALDRLWNRTVTFVVVAALLLAVSVAPLAGLLRRWRGARNAST